MPVWLDVADIVYFHQQCIDEHGGLRGDARQGLLESTLARPQNLQSYDPDAGLFEMAASYGFGFARNHCFSDGNKRISLISIDVFLQVNGFELNAAEVDAVAVIRELASGELSESGLALWIKNNSQAVDIDAT
jgi:death-on-curing protein